jgi:Flp pilus assembly protein TadD
MKEYTAEYQPWPKKVFQQFRPEQRKILLESFRFNPLGWKILFSGDMFDACCSFFGKKVQDWTPLNISLLEYGSSAMMLEDCDTAEDNNAILQKLLRSFQPQPGYQTPSQVALTVALQLKSRFGKEAMGDLLPFLTVYGDCEETYDVDLWAHIFPLMDNLLENPDHFYLQLLRNEPSEEAIRLVSTAILAQPIEESEKIDRFLPLFSQLGEDECVGIIQYLQYRGAHQLSLHLAEAYLQDHGFQEIDRYRIEKIPVYKQQVYLQRVEHYLILLNIAGDAEEYQRIIGKFKDQLAACGYCVEDNSGFLLKSRQLLPEKIFQIAANRDWECWEEQLLPNFCRNSSGIKILLKSFFSMLYEPGEDDTIIAAALVQAGKNATWFPYFHTLAGYIIANISSEFLKEQVTLLQKTSFCDYGLACECVYDLQRTPQQSIYWGWIDLLKQASKEETKSKILTAYGQTNDWEGVIEVAEWIRNSHHLSQDGLLLLGKAYLAVDEYEKSVSVAREILSGDTRNIDGNLLIGLGYAANGIEDLAIEHLGKAIEYDSSNAKAWIALAELHKKADRTDLAITTLQRALEAIPDHPAINVALSRLFKKIGDPQTAYFSVIGFEKNLTETLEDFVYFIDLLWEIDELAELQDMVFGPGEQYLENDRVVYFRAKLLEFKGQQKNAIFELESFLSGAGASTQTLDLYFQLLVDVEEVISMVESSYSDERLSCIKEIVLKAAKEFPEVIAYQLYAAEIQLLSGEFQEAYGNLQQLCFQSDVLPPKLRTRMEFDIAFCSRHMGEIDLAMATFESLQKIYPEDASILVQLAETCMLNNLPSQVDYYASKVIHLYPEKPKIVEWFLATLKYLKENPAIRAVLCDLLEQFPDSLAMKKAFIVDSLANGNLAEGQQELQTIVQSDIGLLEEERTDFVLLALQSNSLEIASRLIDAGGESYSLPLVPLMFYLCMLMEAKKYGLALVLIQQYSERSEQYQLIKVLAADCQFYLGQYDVAEKVLLEILTEFEGLDLKADLSQFVDFTKTFSINVEDLLQLQSPISIYLRLALAARSQGNLDDYRSYSEKALALDLNHPVSQYAFTLAVQLNGDSLELPKLHQLLNHWQQENIKKINVADTFTSFRQDLLAELLLLSSRTIGTHQIAELSYLSRKTPKLQYALEKVNRQQALPNEKLSVFLQQREVELNEVREYSLSYGLNSIFRLFALDDLWFAREKNLSTANNLIWPLISQYFEQNHTEELAQKRFSEMVMALIMTNHFFQELGITEYAPESSKTLDDEMDRIQSFIRSNWENEDWREIRYLWEWDQAIHEKTTILIHENQLQQLSEEMKTYYVLAARKTSTILPADQVEMLLLSPSDELQLQLAMTFAQDGGLVQSWQMIKKAMGKSPDNAIIRFCYANIADQLGEVEAALEGIDSALQIWPDESSWHHWAAIRLLKVGRYDEASLHLEYIDQKNRCTNDEMIELAKAYIHRKAFNKAARTIQKISGEGENEQARTALLLLLAAAKGEEELANTLLQDLPCNDELTRSAHLVMANLEIQNGRPGSALKMAEAAYHYSPTHPETILLLAKSLIASGYLKDAERLLSQIPSDSSIWVTIEKLEQLALLPDEGTYNQEVEQAYTRYPNDPEICYLKAKKMVTEGMQEQASELLAVILQQESVKPEIHLFAAKLHAELGNLDKAVEQINLSLQVNSANAEALFFAAAVHMRRREPKRALEFYQKGIQYFENDYRFYYEAGRLLRDMKLYSDAEFMLRKASELAPMRKDIRNQLAGVKALNIVHNVH